MTIAVNTTILLSLLLLLVGWLAGRDARRVAAYGAMAARFYDRVQPIVDDDDAPDEILDMIGFINERLTDPKASSSLRRALTNRVDRSRSNVRAAYFEKRPELLKPFSEACAAALLAITYNDRWTGWLTRLRIELMQQHAESAPAVARDFRDDSRNDGHNGALAAA